MDAAAADTRAHVVLLPVPAQGHINPMIGIARFLAELDICVTFALAARAHASLMAVASGQDHDVDVVVGGGCKNENIRLEVLPDGLPVDLKERVPIEALGASMATLQKGAHDLLRRLLQPLPRSPLASLSSGSCSTSTYKTWSPPCAIIIDSILTWGHNLATLVGLRHFALWTSSASSLSIGIHIPDLVARGYLPADSPEMRERQIDFLPGLSSLRIADIPELFITQEGLESLPFQFLRIAFEQAKGAERVLVNSLYELEKEVMEGLKEEDGVHVMSVGPLFLKGPAESGVSLLEEDRSCLSWLDKVLQEKGGSVLYISFGSVSNIEGHVFEELAHGLEASGERFLWVIRPGEYVKGDGDVGMAMEEVLPENFTKRTAGRGLVVSWAPQVEVLAHASVTAFLSHCGWNSVLESLSNGVPMLGFPQQTDQKTNLKHIVEDWKVGLPLLDRAVGNGKLDRSHVQASVSAIMSSSKGEEARKHALEWKDIAHRAVGEWGSSTSNLQMLAHDIMDGHFKHIVPN